MEGDIFHTADSAIVPAQPAIIARLRVLLRIVDSGIEQEITRARRDIQGIDLAGIGCSSGMDWVRFRIGVEGKRVVGIQCATALGGTFETEQIHLVDALEDAVAYHFTDLTRPFVGLRHVKDELRLHSSRLGIVIRVVGHLFVRGTSPKCRCAHKCRHTHHGILETILHI